MALFGKKKKNNSKDQKNIDINNPEDNNKDFVKIDNENDDEIHFDIINDVDSDEMKPVIIDNVVGIDNNDLETKTYSGEEFINLNFSELSDDEDVDLTIDEFEPGDIINLNIDVPSDADFVIIEDKKTFFDYFSRVFKFVSMVFLFSLATILVYFALSFKIIPENVVGADYKLGDISVISKFYQVNTSELHPGDDIIIATRDTNKDFPIVMNYKRVKYDKSSGTSIYYVDDQDDTGRTYVTNLMYICN